MKTRLLILSIGVLSLLLFDPDSLISQEVSASHPDPIGRASLGSMEGNVNPYGSPYVPPASFTNSPRLESLLSGGKLALSLDDVIALTLENNLDIAVESYNVGMAKTDLLRAQGGGAVRGVSGAFQSSALFSGAIGGGIGSGSGGGGGAGGSGGGNGAVSIGGSGGFDPIARIYLLLESEHDSPRHHGSSGCACPDYPLRLLLVLPQPIVFDGDEFGDRAGRVPPNLLFCNHSLQSRSPHAIDPRLYTTPVERLWTAGEQTIHPNGKQRAKLRR